ncbi:MAG: cbb3-type cytochrome oxidase assembly protein CcoS [Endozoicomonas sp.]
MESLVILIPIALILIALAVRIFFWAVDNGQFDDLEGPAHSILFDDEKKKTGTDTRHKKAGD